MPAEQLSTEQLDLLLGAAVAAPSMHNTQPWRFEVEGHVVDLYLDGSRRLPAEDPTGRAMRIAAGAAAFNLRCAAAATGYTSWIGLAPFQEDPDLLARIVLQPSATPDRELQALYEQIPRRHTDRRPAGGAAITDDVRVALLRAAYAEDADLTWLTEPAVEAVLGMLVDTDLREIGDWHRRSERAHWIGGNRRQDGVPTTALGPRSASYPAAVRDLATRPLDRTRAAAGFERHPALAVLSTERDDPADQVAAGLALERILLTATAAGVSASFLNQPLEFDDLRRQVQKLTGKPGHANMIIRFAYGHPGGTTARRPVQDFLSRKEQP